MCIGLLPNPSSQAGALPWNVVVPPKPPPNVVDVKESGGATDVQSVGAGPSEPTTGDGRTPLGVPCGVADRDATVFVGTGPTEVEELVAHPASAETRTSTSGVHENPWEICGRMPFLLTMLQVSHL